MKGAFELLSERRGRVFLSREMREMKSDFALKLFKEIVSRWIEDLSRAIEN